MAGFSIPKIFLPKSKPTDTGVAQTSTFKPGATTQALSAPGYTDHRTDVFTSRQSSDSRRLLFDLFKHDPDVSAAVGAFLTVAGTPPLRYITYTAEGQIDPQGHLLMEQMLTALTIRSDYSTGFQITPSLESLAEQFRYMILLRGGLATEMLINKLLAPTGFRHVDLATVKWKEPTPGVYKPFQEPAGGGNPIDLDIPNFFVKFYRQNPLEIYSHSPFVSCINTIASRQQVLNDLYRIMKKTGHPRLDVTIVEEVLRNSAPAAYQNDPEKMTQWVNEQIEGIRSAITNLRSDSAFVHTDSSEAKIIGEGASKSLDATAIIDILNAQNQASLKTMATVIGRGESGVNTATVEARIFSLNADSINKPIAELFTDAFSRPPIDGVRGVRRL